MTAVDLETDGADEREWAEAASMPGRICADGATRSLCRIAAISADGVRLTLFSAVGLGRRVTVSLPGGSRHAGTIVWEGEEQAGCVFRDPVAPSLLAELAGIFACEPQRRAAWALH